MALRGGEAEYTGGWCEPMAVPTRETIETALLEAFTASVDGFEDQEVRPAAPLAEMGVSSLELVTAVTHAMRRLGVTIDGTAFAQVRTFDDLVAAFSAAATPARH